MKLLELVEDILREDEESRSSDKALYLKVIDEICREKGIKDIRRKAIKTVFEMKLPSYETVGRARRKIQEEIPELQASPEVLKERRKREREWKKWAVCGGDVPEVGT